MKVEHKGSEVTGDVVKKASHGTGPWPCKGVEGFEIILLELVVMSSRANVDFFAALMRVLDLTEAQKARLATMDEAEVESILKMLQEEDMGLQRA